MYVLAVPGVPESPASEKSIVTVKVMLPLLGLLLLNLQILPDRVYPEKPPTSDVVVEVPLLSVILKVVLLNDVTFKIVPRLSVWPYPVAVTL